MTPQIDAKTLKAWLGDGREIALIDVSEHGQYGSGHPFFAVSLPYSRFELGLPALVPNQAARLVLCDEGDGVAARAAARARSLGYRDLHILSGGKADWRRAGFSLYAGVNVPSKTFGELVAHARATPQISPQRLRAMQDAGENFVIVDGRPFAEYRKMSIPGGICCPNGELVLRIRDIAPDPKTKIVVNCAGRTRSIIGAQTLREFGIPNPVLALENGTQGWFLAGLELAHDAHRRHGQGPADTAELAARARQFALARGVAYVAPATALAWLTDAARTTYLLDVRTAEEHAAQAVPGFAHAPGGQLIQATDQWVAVKGARLVLADAEMVRASVVAGWLRQLGHDACVLDGGITAAATLTWPHPIAPLALPDLPPITAPELAQALDSAAVQVLDLRPAMAFRQGHIAQARWSIRPSIAAALDRGTRTIVLIADEADIAALAALDIGEAGGTNIRRLAGEPAAWREAGLRIVATPDQPADTDCIDFLFFVHTRHAGDAQAARQYLAWETGLLDQLDAQERGAFRLAAL
ncbi:MAG TPA: rhodanese-like domain-containing protein [Xanthobacteraceae bacterium]